MIFQLVQTEFINPIKRMKNCANYKILSIKVFIYLSKNIYIIINCVISNEIRLINVRSLNIYKYIILLLPITLKV